MLMRTLVAVICAIVCSAYAQERYESPYTLKFNFDGADLTVVGAQVDGGGVGGGTDEYRSTSGSPRRGRCSAC